MSKEHQIISNEFAEKYKYKKVPWGFNGLGYIVYKRTYARIKEDGKTEEWHETIQRCINGAQKIGAKYTKEEAERLFDLVFNLKCNFAGRMLWQLGTPTVDRFGANSLLNCWFTAIREPKSFLFLFENLMLGGGVGYSIRREDVHELPRVKKGVSIKHALTKDADFIVPDSREGWVKLLSNTLDAFYNTGKSFTYSTILVRGANEKINGFGGTASGPSILIDGIEKITKIFQSREGKKLRSIDVLDICNIIGSIVVAGNVRRSAEIALGDPDDYLYLRAKNWSLGNIPNWRAMSNNTIYADSYDQIQDDVWKNGYELDENGIARGEPYGFFNLPLSQKYGRTGEKRKDDCEGTNPCQPYWAKVLTPNGIKMLGDINIGDEIWSSDGWTKVLNKWSNGVKPVYKYRTTSSVFYGTAEHRVVCGGEKKKVCEADGIDIITGPILSNAVLSPEDIIDGLVIGDGMVHKASNNLVLLNIGQNDQDYFSSEISKKILRKREEIGGFAYEVETSIEPQELPLLPVREVPSRFLFGSGEKVVGFLRGLYSANGSICGNSVKLKSTSSKLIEQAQAMLSSIGIKSYYTTNKPQNIKFTNGEYLCKESYDLNITTDIEKFYQTIGFIQKHKNEKLKNLIDNISTSFKQAKNNHEIIEKTLISEEEVFDITVNNKSHTYWSQGCNVSNCGEISLSNYECCNLSELYLNNIESEKELIECAKLLYKTQKAISAMPFLHEETERIVHKNMRLGLGVTGICQSFSKLEWLDTCYLELRKFDKEWSRLNNWPESIKLTTIKPSGTLSLLAGSTPGVHPAYSKYYIRRIRMSSQDTLVGFCRSLGYHVEYAINFDGTEDHNTAIVEFPCESGENAKIASEIDAIEQLELVKKMQKIWADNAVSVTVYYKPEELQKIKSWLSENYEKNIKSVSFLLHQEHGFKQAPYEEISKETYIKLKSKIKNISEQSDEILAGASLEGIECAGGACPTK